MSECQEHSDTWVSARDTVVIMLRLADREIARAPDRIIHALQSDALARAIRETLEAEGRRLAESQRAGHEVTSEDGQQVLEALASAAGGAIRDDVRQQIERSSGYHEVQQHLRQLQESFRCSPMGVFLSEHSTWLYIVASGLALGGVTALYVTRTGDTMSSWATDFAARRLRSIRIGSLEAGTEALRFVPSQRVVEVQPFVTVQQWHEIRTTFRLHAAFRDDQLQTVRGGAEIVVPIRRGVTASVHGMAGAARPTTEGGATGALQPVYDIGLSISIGGLPNAPGLSVRSEFFLQQDTERRRVGGSGTVEYDIGHGVSGTLRGSGSYTQPLATPGRGQTDVSVQAGLTYRFQ